MLPRKCFKYIISLCLSIAVSHCSYVKKDSYPKISDIITFSNARFEPKIPPNVVAKNFSINIENLDMRKFLKNQGSYMKQILGDTSMLDGNISQTLNGSRRNIPLHWWTWEYNTATMKQAYTKVADIMLQTIYMARHKIKLLERKAAFKKETIAYRVAFLYEKLRIQAKKINSMYTTMYNKRNEPMLLQHVGWYNMYRSWNWEFLHPMLVLHHKMAKVHVDFLYMWWVYIKMYGKHAEIMRIPNTTPKEY